VSAFVTIHLHWTSAALVTAFAIMIAGVGLSLIIAGATLVHKRIQIVNDTVLMLVMLVSASALPLFRVPGWWSAARHAFPVTDGVGRL
jgi:hypothetical protein